MSNFSFADDPRFLRNPDCKMMYEFASAAERAYRTDRIQCCIQVRFFLEVFCPFVSVLKEIDYPEPRRAKDASTGWYLYGQNRKEFIRAVGRENCERVGDANAAANSFLHVHAPARDDLYPDLIQNLYILLSWLYRQLNPSARLHDGGYSPARIPAGGDPTGPDRPHTPESTLRDLKKAFPNCNTAQLCSVEREGGRYIIRDLHGRQTGELPAPEALAYSQAQIRQLESQMEQAKEEYDHARSELVQMTQDKEQRIRQLEGEVTRAAENRQWLTEERNQKVASLKREIQRLESRKDELSETYKKRLSQLGGCFEDLNAKYQALLPVEAQRDALRRKVRGMMEQSAAMQAEFSRKQDALLAQVAEARQHLADAQARIRQMNCAEVDSQSIISQLRQELDQKESELLEAQSAVQELLRQQQAETVRIVQSCSGSESTLWLAEASTIRFAGQFREFIDQRERSEQISGSLQTVNQGVAKLNQGCDLYMQHPDAQKLKDFLWQVKIFYETQLARQEELLREKDRELEAERQRYNDLFDAMFRTPPPPAVQELPEAKVKKKKRGGKLLAAAVLLLVLGLLAFTAVNRSLPGRLGSWFPGVLPGEAASADDGDPPPDPSGEQAGLPAPAEELTPAVNGDEPPPETPEAPASEDPGAPEAAPPPQVQEPPAETPPAAPGENDPDSQAQHAAGVLEQMREDFLQSQPPGSFEEIPGVNSALLEEMENLDLRSIRSWGPKTTRDDMYYTGETPLPAILSHSLNSWGVLNAEMTDTCQMCNMTGNEVIQFAYCDSGKWAIMTAAEITDLSDQLSRGSTRAEVERVLGKGTAESTLGRPTIFTEASLETAVIYHFEWDSVIVCFDEAGTVCDYVYIKAASALFP